MADPHIKSPMDFWDYLTVIVYRSGFILATIMVLLLPYQTNVAQYGLFIAGAMLAGCVHLYLKSFRLFFQLAAWIGLLCAILGWPLLATGAMLLIIGGLSYKEYFCFRIFGLNFQPIFVALLWFSLVFQAQIMTQILSVIIGVLLALLSIQKWRMPLHFDIGDKTKYQI